MNIIEAQKLLEKTDSDHSQKQMFFRGLSIIAKYDDDIDPFFEHDQVWLSRFEETVVKMSKEEVLELAKAGWFEDGGGWSHF